MPGDELSALCSIHHPGTDLDPFDACERLDLALDVSLELITKRAGGYGQGDLHAHDTIVERDSRTMPSSTMSGRAQGR